VAKSIRCLSCGVACSESAKFCSQCGARLQGQAATGGNAGEASSPRERRQLTVMFCDLVESTKLSLELDAEDFTNAVSAYRDACVRVVRYWKGYISRYVGDGVLIYFGYPRAAEDDALRGVAAAWELVHAIPELSLPSSVSAMRSGALPKLRARISLHTGLAVVGDVVGRDSIESDGALGAAPNIAARLQTLAQPGEVVISETTAALLPPTIRLKPLEVGRDRSDVGSVRAYTIAEMPQDFVQRRPVSVGSLIGRQAPLERVLLQLDESREDAAGVLLCGEPGVGKSRLVQEVIKHPDAASATWLQLACSAYGEMSPLHPFRDWLGEVDASGGARASPPHGAQRDKKDAEATALGESSTSPYDRRTQIFQRLRAALFAYAPRVGLVIEDVHWADSTTLEFVGTILSAPAPGRLFVLMTSRQLPNDALMASGRLRVEKLDRLPPGDAASLARSLSATRPLTAFELAEIVDHADGVPLFIEEFVRALDSKHADPDHIPITLRDSLMGVLDNLGTGRTVALCASVFGRRFDYLHLKELLQFEDGELASAVEALTKAQILVQAGEIPNASLEFRHALLRDTAYHTLLKSERERWHRRVAALTTAGTLSIEESMPELLARHHSLGGSYKSAIDYWLRAQSQAMQRSANVEALAHIRSGLEDCRNLSKDEPGEGARLELELLRKLTAPLIAVSGWSTPELEEVYDRAMNLCRTTGSEDAEFDLERGLYNLHLLRSELRTADTIADRLLATARGAQNPNRREHLLLVALRSKALPAFYAASYQEARSHLDEMLSLYEPAKHAGHAFHYGTEPAMVAQSYLAWMDAIDGEAVLARERIAEALKRARAEGHVFSICYGLCFAASCAQLSGDADRAAEHAEEALRLGNQHNFQYWLAWAKAIQGWVKGLGAPRPGIALIEQARAGYLATGSSLVAPYFEALACDIARSGKLDDVAQRETSLRACGEETGVWFWQGALRA
jgi:class 3 adenylate cyclase/tetratricopeptide (TPR) repeat protein